MDGNRVGLRQMEIASHNFSTLRTRISMIFMEVGNAAQLML